MSRQTTAWRDLARQFRALCARTDEPCALCLGPIDYSLSGRHPDGFSADHIEPIGKGGALIPSMDGLRPAHMRCNSSRGAGRSVDATAWGW
jgi:hypothetical protein